MILMGGASSYVGKVRHNNEDNFLINGCYKKDVAVQNCEAEDFERHKHYVFAVFDGIGGVESGEIASLRAAEAVSKIKPEDAFKDISKLAYEANSAVCNEKAVTGYRHMGSTIAALCSDGKNAFVCNVGDSSCFLFRNDILKKMSKDHNRAQQMVDFGIITEDEARKLSERHVLTQHLGIFPDEFVISPYICGTVIQAGDIFLLCSDGITDMLSDEDISLIIKKNFDSTPLNIAESIVEKAWEKGGSDNITAIIVKGIEE